MACIGGRNSVIFGTIESIRLSATSTSPSTHRVLPAVTFSVIAVGLLFLLTTAGVVHSVSEYRHHTCCDGENFIGTPSEAPNKYDTNNVAYGICNITRFDSTSSNKSPGTAGMRTAQPLAIIIETKLDGEWFEVLDVVNIKWNSTGGAPPLKVKLEFSHTGLSGNWWVVKSGLPPAGEYQWSVPQNISYACHIRASVTDGNGNTSYDWNSNPFYIRPSTKTGILSGIVLNENREGIQGATVRIAELKLSVDTSSDGKFAINVPPGGYMLEVSKQGYNMNRTSVVVVGLGDEPQYYVIILHKEGNITPTVMAGVILFVLLVIASLVVFYHLDRKRKWRLRGKKTPPPDHIGLAATSADDVYDADRYWETGQNACKHVKNTKKITKKETSRQTKKSRAVGNNKPR